MRRVRLSSESALVAAIVIHPALESFRWKCRIRRIARTDSDVVGVLRGSAARQEHAMQR